MYPGTMEKPEGKLRLLYEGFPMAFLAEAAGGRATNGKIDILDIHPTSLHQRTPLFIGNKDNVDEVTDLLSGQE